jgi:RNA-binding protein YlmH
MYFVNKLLQADFIISKNKVKVNGKIKHKRYLVSVGDLIVYNKNYINQRVNRVK